MSSGMSTAGYYSGFDRIPKTCAELRMIMGRHKWLRRIVILALLFVFGMMILSPDDKEEGDIAQEAYENRTGGKAGTGNAVGVPTVQADQTIVGWLIERIADGEVELSDENSIKRALEEAEVEFEVSLTEEDEEKIVGFLQTLGSVGVEAEGFIDQAKQKYQQYSTELVEEANESINEAVEDAVTDAAESFFDSIGKTVSDFFTNLIAGNG